MMAPNGFSYPALNQQLPKGVQNMNELEFQKIVTKLVDLLDRDPHPPPVEQGVES